MTITDTDRRIAATLGEAIGLMTDNYDASFRYPFQTWAANHRFTGKERAELYAIFAEGLTAITTPSATPGKLEPVVNLTLDQIKQGMRRPIDGDPIGSRLVQSVSITNLHNRKIYTTGQSGFVYYTDGTKEYVNPGHKITFLADSVPSEPEPTWITRHIPVPDVLPGMVTGDGTRIKDVVVRTSLATGEKTYDVRYPDFEDADLGRNETIGVRCDRTSRLPLIPRT